LLSLKFRPNPYPPLYLHQDSFAMQFIWYYKLATAARVAAAAATECLYDI
jgi:hypothetical protein